MSEYVKLLHYQDHPSHTLVKLHSNKLVNKETEHNDIDIEMKEFADENSYLSLQNTDSFYSDDPKSPRYSDLGTSAHCRLRSLLESAHDTNPPFSMRSSNLAILMKWAAD